jgi:hypothetical protein
MPRLAVFVVVVDVDGEPLVDHRDEVRTAFITQ